MPTAEAHIETERARRYLVQLCRHASQMRRHLRHRPRAHDGGEPPPEVQHAEWSDTYGIVRLSSGQWTMRATGKTLTLTAEASDDETLRRIQDLVAARLETIGRRDHLTVNWQRPETPAAQSDDAAATAPAPEGRAVPRRRRVWPIAVTAAGALAVALHLGLGGALLADSRWTGWAANFVLAVVLVKVIVVVATGVHRFTIRRGKPFKTP
jgi:hypothetical protein